MRLLIDHQTRYFYEDEVSLGPHNFLLRPRENAMVSVRHFRLSIEPEAKVNWLRDHNENGLLRAFFRDPTRTLSVRVEMEVETLESNPFDFILDSEAFNYPFTYNAREASALQPYIDPTAARGPAADWVREILPALPEETLTLLLELNSRVKENLRYMTRGDAGIQPIEETLRLRSGSCRDIAFLMMHAVRALGFAARFASGYLYEPGTQEKDQESGSLHAWTEIFLPGAGWKGFDPTNGILCDDHFIPLAVGRQPDNLNPVSGLYYGQRKIPSTFQSRVRFQRLDPVP